MAKAKAKAKNTTFSWQATNKKGQVVKGETNAANADIVKAELRKLGLVPKKGKIKKKGGSLFSEKKETHYYKRYCGIQSSVSHDDESRRTDGAGF